jgi:hypothetical protein
LRRGLLYVGTDDGLVQVTRDDGATWTRIAKFPDVPELTYVSRVLASAHDTGTVYVALDGHRSNDFRPYLLKSTDYGKSFRAIAAGLPADAPVYVVREHPRTPDLLFAGTEYGVFVSRDGGQGWAQLKQGIAPAPVHDLVIHPRENDLVVGTHGRGIYILDDLAALERLPSPTVASPVVFAPRPATIQNQHSGSTIPGDRNYRKRQSANRRTAQLLRAARRHWRDLARDHGGCASRARAAREGRPWPAPPTRVGPARYPRGSRRLPLRRGPVTTRKSPLGRLGERDRTCIQGATWSS